jgi:carbon monoxide dehydrogenase subunit G
VRFDGSVAIRAPRPAVWEFLVDPRRVAACGPGVEQVEILDDTHFRIRARVGIGIVSASFVIECAMEDVAPIDHARISASGKAPGSAVDGAATMTLSDGDAGSTVMDWSADVNVHGRIASVGARLMEGTARRLIGQTFDCVRARLEA